MWASRAMECGDTWLGDKWNKPADRSNGQEYYCKLLRGHSQEPSQKTVVSIMCRSCRSKQCQCSSVKAAVHRSISWSASIVWFLLKACLANFSAIYRPFHLYIMVYVDVAQSWRKPNILIGNMWRFDYHQYIHLCVMIPKLNEH